MRTAHAFLWLIAVVLILSPLTTANAGTIYVNHAATGANNGSSWSDAFTDLQSALSAVTSGNDIWVAKGTYKPTKDGDRTISFVMKEDVNMYGGFAGTENTLDQRDWSTNETILNGDLLDNDNDNVRNDEPTRQDNSLHVVMGANHATMDGFTISGGTANDNSVISDRGGGMINWESVSPTVKNCLFINNSAGRDGGGMVNWDNCNTNIINCRFINNAASQGNATGGGIANVHSSSAKVQNCIFVGNTALVVGGGLYNYMGGSQIVTNCTFIGNQASGGGGMYNYDNSLTVTNCTFVGNIAENDGGGLTIESNVSSLVDNCILWNNSSPNNSQIASYSSNSFVSFCDVQDGWLGQDNIDADPLFIRNPYPGADGIWGTQDDDYGDLRLQQGSICIDTGNNAAVPADITIDLDGNPRIADGNHNGQIIVDMGAYEYIPSVYFADANLKLAVEQALGVTNPTYDDMLKLTYLNAVNKGIGSLIGLETAGNLTTLYLNQNAISDITPLAGLTKLTVLNLYMNTITDLSPVSGLINLYVFACSVNKVSDITPLNGLSNLVYLYINNNQISDFSALTGQTKLKEIYAARNAVLTKETYLAHIPAIRANNPNLAVFQYDPGCKTPISGDVNQDCRVNLADLAVIASNWLKCSHIYEEMCE